MTLPGNLKKIAACLLVGVILSIISRTDVNWDLQNYHLYGPFSALNGRIGADYFAAGFQGYLNPLVDLPYYIAKFIVFSKHPVVVAGLAGLPFGLLAYIVWRIARVLLPEGNAWEPAIAAVLGLTGAITLSEVGTTLDDVTVADVVLSGVLCALTEWKYLPSAAALSGLAIGCATGLKLTAFLFAPGVLLICLLQTAGLRQILLVISLFCVALGIGFLTTWGWWGYLLWRQFQNPLFPMFASIFPSPWSQGVVFHDTTYLPKSLLQWLFYPFYWLQGRSLVVVEGPLRDPRFAIVYLAVTARLVAIWRQKSVNSARSSSVIKAFWAFFVLSYICWLIGFSILRYAIALEATSGIMIWTAIRPIFSKKFSLLALTTTCLITIASTRTLGWKRMDYSKDLVEAPIPVLAPHTLVFLSGHPISFVIPYLNTEGSWFIALDSLPTASAEFSVVQKLVQEAGDIRLLTNADTTPVDITEINGRLAPFNLVYSESTCAPIYSAVQKRIRLCAVGRHPSVK